MSLITVRPLGGIAESTNGATTTLPNLTVFAGELLVVSLTYKFVTSPGFWFTSLQFDGVDMIPMNTLFSAHLDRTHFYLPISADGTLDLVFTPAEHADEKPRVLTAVAVSGVSGWVTAQDCAQNGTGTIANSAPNNFASFPPAAATDGLIFGSVGTYGPEADTEGAWGNDFIAIQRVGTTAGANGDITVADAYLVVSNDAPLNITKSGMTSREWVAISSRFTAPPDGGPAGSTQSAPSIVEVPHYFEPNLTPPAHWTKHVAPWMQKPPRRKK